MSFCAQVPWGTLTRWAFGNPSLSISMPPTMNTPKPKPGEHQLAGQYYWVSLTTMGPRQLQYVSWLIVVFPLKLPYFKMIHQKHLHCIFRQQSEPRVPHGIPKFDVVSSFSQFFPMFWGTSHFHPRTLDSHAALGAPSLIQAQCTWVHIHNQHIKHSIDSKCQMICIYTRKRRGSPFPIKCCCNSAFHWEDQQRY